MENITSITEEIRGLHETVERERARASELEKKCNFLTEELNLAKNSIAEKMKEINDLRGQNESQSKAILDLQKEKERIEAQLRVTPAIMLSPGATVVDGGEASARQKSHLEIIKELGSCTPEAIAYYRAHKNEVLKEMNK